MVMSPIHQVWPKPSCKAQWKGEEDKADRGRGGKTTSGNGQAWSLPSPSRQWWWWMSYQLHDFTLRIIKILWRTQIHLSTKTCPDMTVGWQGFRNQRVLYDHNKFCSWATWACSKETFALNFYFNWEKKATCVAFSVDVFHVSWRNLTVWVVF